MGLGRNVWSARMLVLLGVFTLIVGVPGALAQDNCAEAISVGLGDTAFSTADATTDGPAHDACTDPGDQLIDNDIWFDFVATDSGDLTASTCGSAFDTMVAIYQGCDCPVSDATLLYCGDDEGDCGTQTVVTAPVVEGECYKIRVGGYSSSSSGSGTLNLSIDIFNEVCLTATGDCFETHAEPGCNMPDCCDEVCDTDDYCCNVEWDTNCRDIALDMCGGLGACCNAEGVCEDSVTQADCTGQWYQETLCEDVNCVNAACIEADGGCWGIEPNTTPGCSDSSCCDLVCDDDDFCCNVEWDTSCVDAAWVLCGGPTNFGACCVEGDCTGTVAEAECDGIWFQGQNCSMVNCQFAEQDFCQSAGPIYDGDTFFDTTAATTDGPAHAACSFDGQTYNDIWFEYIATNTGDLIVSTCNTADYDTDLVVYDGCDCPVDDARMLACNDDGSGCEGYTSLATAPIVEGQCYKIRIGGYSDGDVGTGTVNLDIDIFPEACVDATGECFEVHAEPGCNMPDCCDTVCDDDMYCCEVEWDTNCRDTALAMCGGLGACCNAEGVCEESIPEAECTGQWYQEETCENVNCLNTACVDADGGCWGIEPNTTPGCSDSTCCDLVCDDDDYCCNVEWDSSCVDSAWALCGGPTNFGACCVEGNCTGTVMEAECDGIWFQGMNCSMINCEFAEIDFCQSASPIEEGTHAVDTSIATTDGPGHAECAGDGVIDNDVWFQFIPDVAGDLLVDTCGSDFDTMLAVYEGCDCPVTDDRLMVCGDDDGDCGLQTEVIAQGVMPGTCYLIRMGGYGTTSMGNGTLTVEMDIFPEVCGTATGECFFEHAEPGCSTPDCCDTVCDEDMYCCEVEWDTNCVDMALNMCGGLGGCCNAQGVCEDSIPEAECDGEWFQETACENINCTNVACLDADGDCWGIDPNDTPGCADSTCCDQVCDEDSFCCEVEWDENCVDMAWAICGGPTGRGACCVDGEDCAVTTAAECDGLWIEGVNCSMIDCNNPISDTCPGPEVVPGDIVAGFTTGMGTDDEFGTCITSIDAPGVWYALTGTGNRLIATTCHPDTNYDTKLNVYCSSCEDPICVGGNDDSPAGLVDRDCIVPEVSPDYIRASSVEFCSVLGAEYFILVQGFSGAEGNFGLEIIDEGPCSDGDEACVPPIGACCDGLTCIGDTAPQDCNGAWYGGQTCDDFVCPAGACCDGEECLGTMPESECDYRWFMGEDCATFDCPSCEYCDICYTDLDDDWITNVTFGDINRTSDAETGSCSYADATNLSTSVEPGQSYPISVSFYSGIYNECVKVYVDWNQDCAFSEAEGTEIACGTDATVTGTIAVPANALEWLHDHACDRRVRRDARGCVQRCRYVLRCGRGLHRLRR